MRACRAINLNAKTSEDFLAYNFNAKINVSNEMRTGRKQIEKRPTPMLC